MPPAPANPIASDADQDDGGFPIVGIGASAGGVEALRALTASLEAESPVAIVIILHLPADASSQLAELLDQHCPLPVHRISDGLPLNSGVVHVLPPGFSVDLEAGHLRLHERPPAESWRPVDRFFASLATQAGERAVAVVLSGTGDNGAVALSEIKQAGGLVLAQQPGEASFRDMPRNAIATGHVDQVGSCAELAAAIYLWGRRLPILHRLAAQEQDEVDRALSLVCNHTGQDFRRYKRGTMERRIQRRSSMRFCDSIADYLKLLHRDELEIERLSRDLLIGVTAFFRDAATWRYLSGEILPELLQRQPQAKPFRAWVAGCASGEEAYSLAIILAEELEARNLQRTLQIFATDIDQQSCERARRGFFPSSAVAGLNERLLARYFSREGSGYRISNAIRDMITFAHHNLLRDPPFSQLDLITCRNVLIYLDGKAQEQVLGMFHFALRRGGILLLGSSETAQRHDELFHSLDDSHRLYRRRQTHSPSHAFSMRHRPSPRPMPHRGQRTLDQRDRAQHELVLGLAQRHFAPAFVLVDERYQVRYYSGPAGEFLQQPDGVPTDDLLTICPDELLPRLRAALPQVLRTGEPQVLHYTPSGRTPVEVQAQPVSGIDDEHLCMVSFRWRTGGNGHAATEAVANGELAAEDALHSLDQELRSTREELSSPIEELETSNEELKASNDEARSMYEELQSTNEELETSREELQAACEELSVLNQRLQGNMAELAETNDVLNNLLSCTNLPTIFLDRRLRIQRFTPTAARLLRLIAGDIGRPFDDMADRISAGLIMGDARQVLDSLIPAEREIQAEDGTWFILRVHPYRTSEDRIDGVVITLADIEAQKRAEAELRDSEQRYRSIFENAAVGLAQLDAAGRICTVNSTLSGIMQLPQHLLVDRPFVGFFAPEIGRTLAATLDQVSLDGSMVIEVPLPVPDGCRQVRCTCSSSSDGNHALIVIVEDITDRHRAEARLQKQTSELKRSNEDLSHFAAMASHDLQAPLRLIGMSLEMATELDDLTPEQRHEHLATAKQAAARMRTMIIDLLQYAHAEMSDQQPEPCDTAVVVQQVLENLTVSIRNCQAAIEVVALPMLMAPPRLLTQLFQNLIDNAITYSRDGVAPRIHISAERGQGEWILHVADNGRGIPPEHREHVFELFNRSGAGSSDGSGLGLAICRKSIQRVGGRIWVDSGADVGATFSFSIPDRTGAPAA